MKLTSKFWAFVAVIAFIQGQHAFALNPSEAAQTSKNVDVQLELLPEAMSGNSNLVVQLDNPEAAEGADNTFAGLQPGMHTARVILMDEQNQPLQGGVAMVHFRVHATTTGTAAVPPQQIQGAPAPPIPPELRSDGDPVVPLKSSPLLLVSMIGFALLIGGILPGIRSRKVAVHP